jgi:catechol 2,3-dioxygenase-like lactoylglutathione lyase family enzyme
MADDARGKVTGFFHAGLTVSDMERSLLFYRDTLGLEVVSDTTRHGDELEPLRTVIGVHPEVARVVFLEVPNSGGVKVELFAYEGVEQHVASARPWDVAAGHFCVYTDDADALYGRLVERGYSTRNPVRTITSGPHTGAKAVYMKDPDGYLVECYQPATG